MQQLNFHDLDTKEEFEAYVSDAILYCNTAATVARCVLKEIKARGHSTMGAKAFVHILLSTAAALEDYASRVAEELGVPLKSVQATPTWPPSQEADEPAA